MSTPTFNRIVFKENIPSTINRVAVFASYSEDHCIHDYVTYYIKGLREIADVIMFIADNDILPEEIEKIKGFVVYAQYGKHNEYDFGSYKYGFRWALENNILTGANELVFCNDSCYGPVFPFSEAFKTMQNVDTDFWGMVRSHEIKPHLQSYFIVFRRKVFSASVFQDFVNDFTKQNSQIQYIMKYELRFAETLEQAGFKYTSYTDTQKLVNTEDTIHGNPMMYPVSLYRMRMPLIKKKAYLIDFSWLMNESITDVHTTLATQNAELYNAICQEIRTYYTNKKTETKDWLNIAISCIESQDLLGIIANAAENYHKALDELKWKNDIAHDNEQPQKEKVSKKEPRTRLKAIYLYVLIAIGVIILLVLTISVTL